MSARPKRIQLRRTRGWRLPEGAVSVARATKWGNPFPWHTYGYDGAVVAFEEMLECGDEKYPSLAEIRTELRGKDLACWCYPDQPCHGDVLLEVANS